jgi:hypothetical protein
MAINWNQAEYVAPKLQIVPEQLPIEAGVKVGTVLQDRFDKSYENLTKAEEALRQMALNANEVDKPEVERIYNQYSEQLKGIDKSDLHNARWKTLKLATEAANNYISVAEKNKKIQAQEEMISKNPIWATSREKKLKDFKKGLPSIGWDAEKRTFTNLNVSPYSAPADVNITEKAVKYGSTMKPKNFGFQNGEMLYEKADGTKTNNIFEASAIYHVVNGEKKSKLTPEAIQNAVTAAITSDSEVKAMMNWDLGYEGIDPNNPEQQEQYKKYIQETIVKPITAASQLLEVNDEFTSNDVTVSGGVNGSGSGNDNDNSVYEPTSINPFGGKGKDKDNLTTSWEKMLKGDTKSEFLIKNIIPSEIEKLRKTNPEKAESLEKEYNSLMKFKELADKYPQVKENLPGIGLPGISDVVKMGKLAALAVDPKIPFTDEERKLLLNKKEVLDKSGVDGIMGHQWRPDTDLGDLYNDAESNSFRNISIQRPSLTNNKFRTALENLNLTIDAFNIDKESWKGANKKVKVVGYSTEPLGNGQGHVYELQDENGETYYAEAKKTTGRALQFEIARNAYAPILSLENYKNIPIPDKPVKAVDILKAGKVPYLKDEKPNYAFEENAQITPTDRGTFILTYGNDTEPQEYSSIFELFAENENKNFK